MENEWEGRGGGRDMSLVSIRQNDETKTMVQPSRFSVSSFLPAHLSGSSALPPHYSVNSRLSPHSSFSSILPPHFSDRLVGLVVRRPPRERKIPGSNPACAGIFSGSSHTSDLKIGTPVATLPGAWRYRVSAGTGRSGVSIL